MKIDAVGPQTVRESASQPRAEQASGQQPTPESTASDAQQVQQRRSLRPQEDPLQTWRAAQQSASAGDFWNLANSVSEPSSRDSELDDFVARQREGIREFEAKLQSGGDVRPADAQARVRDAAAVGQVDAGVLRRTPEALRSDATETVNLRDHLGEISQKERDSHNVFASDEGDLSDFLQAFSESPGALDVQSNHFEGAAQHSEQLLARLRQYTSQLAAAPESASI